MPQAHESIENLLNGIERCYRELALEIENQYNAGILIEECQPLKDKAFNVYQLLATATDLVEVITSIDFSPAELKSSLRNINLQKIIKDSEFKKTAFSKALKKLKIDELS